MKNIIIGIHGMGNKPDQVTLHNWWQEAITEGLERSGLTGVPFELELVYWADLLHPDPLSPDITDKKHPLFISEPYAPATEQYKNQNVSDMRRRIMGVIGSQLEGIFLNKDLSINFSSVNDFVLRHFFKDLAVYYNAFNGNHSGPDPKKQKAIRSALAETLRRHRKKRVLLIAHSMGAIIGFDVLTELEATIKIDTLVTIGCPLGMPIIRSKTAARQLLNEDPQSALQTPEGVRHKWYNLADLRDKIALYYNLNERFRPNSLNVGVIDKAVINDYRIGKSKNPHKAYGYLRTAEMAHIVHEFLTSKSPGVLNRIRNWLAAVISKPR